MKRILLAFGLLCLVISTFASVQQTFTAKDPGARRSSQCTRSKHARDNFLHALNTPCWNTLTFDYESLNLGDRSFSLGSGITVNFLGNIKANHCGVQTSTTVTASATNGFAISGTQFLRLEGRRSTEVKIVWTLSQFMKAFGTFITGLQSGSCHLDFHLDNGAVETVTLHGSNSGGALFIGVILSRNFNKVTLRVSGHDTISVDDTIFSKFTLTTTEVISRFVIVNPLPGGCSEGFSHAQAQTICHCLGTTLADITTTHVANTQFRSATINCDFWIGSFNGDNFNGAPLVFTFPSVTTQPATGRHGVLCNRP